MCHKSLIYYITMYVKTIYTYHILIIMIILIRFGIEPGLNKTIIATVSNNFMIV